MASANAIEAGRAVLRVVAVEDGVKAVLDDVVRDLQATVQRVRTIGIAVTAAGLAGLASFLPAVNEAARAEEVFSKFGVVFGEAAAGVRLWGEALSEQIGRSEIQIASVASSFQDLLVPVGFDQGPARETSKQLTQLAFDLASFNDQADADTVRDLQAALTGSSETMKKYGVVVNEAAVKQELLNRNLRPEAASEVEKILARLAIIYRQTTAAQGDAARTAGSLTNTLKDVAGEIRDTSAAIGTALLPVVTPLAQGFGLVVSLVGRVAETFPALVTLAGGGAVTMSLLGAALAVVATAALSVISPISLTVLAIRLLNTAAAEYLGVNLLMRAATLAWAFSLRVLSTALIGVRTAAGFLLTNPLVLGITAVTLAVVAMSGAFSQATASVREFRDEANGESTTSAVATAARDAVAELESLNSRFQLNNEEQRRANDLLNQLGDTYNTFGIAVDDTTARIKAQSDAFAKLRNEITQQARSTLQGEIKDSASELRELQEKLAEVGERRTGAGATAASASVVNDAIARTEDRIAQVQDRLAKLRQELANLPSENPLGRETPAGDGFVGILPEIRESEQQLEEMRRQVFDDEVRRQERLADFEQQKARERVEAELRATLEGRALEIAQAEEQAKRDIERAEEIGAKKADIERRLAAEKAEINKRFDAQERALAERREEKEEREEKRRRRQQLNALRKQSVEGSLATRVAGQQFGGLRTDQILERQSQELAKIFATLQRIERKPGGLRAT